MSDNLKKVTSVRMPQVNVNDDEVTLVSWRVDNNEQVTEGRPLCEVETSKAVGDVEAPASGVLRQIKKVGEQIAVGEIFAYIGPSQQDIERHITSEAAASGESSRPSKGKAAVDATIGAVDLARQYNIDLSEIPTEGKIRRSEVEAFITARGLNAPGQGTQKDEATSALPPALRGAVVAEQPLSDHQWTVAEHLTRSQSRMVVAHAAMDVDMTQAQTWIEACRRKGLMTGALPVFIHAAAAALAAESKLATFRMGRQVFRYPSTDIAYTARDQKGRLFTLVVRKADEKSLDDLAAECGRLNMSLFRGQIEPEELSGSCLTVSVLEEQPVAYHVGLQNVYQSVLLTIGAIHQKVVADDSGKPVVRPISTVILSYDHGILDGWEAAQALSALKSAVEGIQV